MAKKKYKPMTKREKEEMKQIRKELREEGLLPPVKKRMNRKAYIEDTCKMWDEAKCADLWAYLTRAAIWVMGRTDYRGNVHPEAIGAAKVLRVAMKIREFMEKKGKSQYSIQELASFLRETIEE